MTTAVILRCFKSFSGLGMSDNNAFSGMLLVTRFVQHLQTSFLSLFHVSDILTCFKYVFMVFRGLSNDRRQMAWNSTADCSRSRSLGLVRSQRRLCQNHLDMMPSVVSASRDTVDLCQDLFAVRRWNCSTIQRAPNFLPDLTGSTITISFYTPTTILQVLSFSSPSNLLSSPYS